MSYDISIRSITVDGFVSKVELRNHLVGLGLVADSDNHLLFQESGVTRADMDLAWFENGNYVEPLELVNCIQVHIPYACVETVLEKIVKQCKQIAEKWDWTLYDEQEGKYL